MIYNILYIYNRKLAFIYLPIKIEAAKIIKSRMHIPIIIFTGYNDKFIHDQVQSIRPAAVLSKMDPVSDIVAAIDKATISQSPIVEP